MTYVVVDIETTGLSKNYHKITEIAAVLMDDGEIKKEFQTLVNPEVRIPSFITRLTGINDEMVKDAPKIDEALPKFLNILKENILVAHNATFDYGFLNQNSLKFCNGEILNQKICTRKLASRLVPDLTSKRLSSLCNHFLISNVQAHRAMADAKATAEVFSNFISMLRDIGINEPEEIVKYQNISRQKCIILNKELKL